MSRSRSRSIEIKGLVFEPDALGRPGMPLVEREEEDHARQAARAGLETHARTRCRSRRRPRSSRRCSTRSRRPTRRTRRQLWTEARQVLRDARAGRRQGQGRRDHAAPARQLRAAARGLRRGREGVGGARRRRRPRTRTSPSNTAWWAYSLLKQFKNAEALAVVKDEHARRQAAGARVRRRRGRSGAPATTPARGTRSSRPRRAGARTPARDALDRDVLLFAGRTNVAARRRRRRSCSRCSTRSSRAQQYELLAKLGLAGVSVRRPLGRRRRRARQGDRRIGGAAVPPNDVPVIRYSQADFTVRLDNPEVAAKYAKQAIDALPACGAKCSRQGQAGRSSTASTSWAACSTSSTRPRTTIATTSRRTISTR